MKFGFSTTLFLISLTSVLATPVPEATFSDPAPITADASLVDRDTSDGPLLGRDIFARATRYCKIISDDGPVNCRRGPGTEYAADYTVTNGLTYRFVCYRESNPPGTYSWQKILFNDGVRFCYVNGYYTDDNCTRASLGPC